MRLAKIILASVVLTGLSLSLCWGADGMKDLKRDEWMSIYFGKDKVGYMHTTVSKDKYKDTDVYRKDQAMSITLIQGDQKAQLDANSTLYISDKFMPIASTSKLTVQQNAKEGPQTQTINLQADYGEKDVKVKVQTPDGKSQEQSVPLGKNIDLSTCCQYELGTKKLSSGEKFSQGLFRIQNLALESKGLRLGFTGEPSTITVLSPAKVDVGGKSLDATPVVDKEDSIETKKWFSDSGELLKTENSTGVVFVKTTKEDAMSIPTPKTTSTPPATGTGTTK